MIEEIITSESVWKNRKKNKCNCKESYPVLSNILPIMYCLECDGWIEDINKKDKFNQQEWEIIK